MKGFGSKLKLNDILTKKITRTSNWRDVNLYWSPWTMLHDEQSWKWLLDNPYSSQGFLNILRNTNQALGFTNTMNKSKAYTPKS